MKILVACEFSGVVREAFKAKGHNVWSCDLLPTEIPGQHWQGDVIEIINLEWDLMIAHPPCTYLSNSGVRWLHEKEGRWDKMKKAALFFKRLLDADNIPKIAVENPIQHGYASKIIGKKYNQIIQPYYFGDPYRKTTCLWLKNLPKLKSTEIVKPRLVKYKDGSVFSIDYNKKSRRSVTYTGIAKAMADQWG